MLAVSVLVCRVLTSLLKKLKKGEILSGLDDFFNAKNIAVIGASRDKNKIGHIILKNLLESKREIFPINPNADEILGKKCYKNINDLSEKIDLAIIAVPHQNVIQVIEDCGKKEVRSVIIISSGFREIGNEDVERQIGEIAEKYEMRIIGPNCLGILDLSSHLDAIFISQEKLKRPECGNVSIATQSGALGAVLLDIAGEQGLGISKFVSYGNALDIDESDVLNYFNSDENTNVIFLYLEAVKNGKKFLETARNCSKPIIVFKGGRTDAGSRAAMSHTGSIAGDFLIYKSVFAQFGLLQAETLEDSFNYLNAFARIKSLRGKKVQIITNGGGYGIIASDAIIQNNLQIATLRKESLEKLRQILPPTASIKNPIDLLGDATNEHYSKSIEICADDKNVDILLVIVLPQTPLINEDELSELIGRHAGKKPIITVISGGEKARKLRESFEKKGIIVYNFPEDACKAIRMLAEFGGKHFQ